MLQLKIKGGLHTRITPDRRRTPAVTLDMVSCSFSMRVERMMVTTGQENTIHKASGTAMYVTLARAVIKVNAAATPRVNYIN